MRTRWLRSALIGSALALAAASASAGQITFFERPTFQGSYSATNYAISDLQSAGYRDTASSVIVNDGVWEACTAVNYGGTCVQLLPGSYATLSRDLNGRVASVRQVAYTPTSARVVIKPDPQPAVVIGTTSTIVSPPVVTTGTATIANPPATVVVNPTPAAVVVPSSGQVVIATPQPAPMPVGRVILYQNPNFSGPSAVVDHNRVADLDWAHFNNPATSVRIQSGTWVACSDMGYQGQCRILEPGDYPVLTGIFDHGISSMHQVWRAS
ncbi:MAG TPA: beta/gamma crystallin-related protein [Casimicrobiaceae bacterium]|nr:beta/gamma crystallin-related protein [Casimicrobiaceae bacterium]